MNGTLDDHQTRATNPSHVIRQIMLDAYQRLDAAIIQARSAALITPTETTAGRLALIAINSAIRDLELVRVSLQTVQFRIWRAADGDQAASNPEKRS